MKYTKIQNLAWLLMAGACFITARSSRGAEFWLRTGVITNTMPDGRAVAMWAFAQDSANWSQPGTLMVPGPQLAVAAGDSLILHVTNTLPEPVSIIIPGQYGFSGHAPAFNTAAPYAGRVRSLTAEAAPHNGVATYTWTSVQGGNFLYHSASHLSVQVQMGLFGALSVLAPGPQVYGVPFNTAVPLIFSEIDPDLHDAVATGSFGPGPGLQVTDFTVASATAFLSAVSNAAPTDPVAALIASQLSDNPTGDPVVLVNDLDTIIGGPSIYDPTAFPDTVLSAATLAQMKQKPPPSQNYPTTFVPFNGNLVRMNRALLQDGLANAHIAFPALNKLTSAIRARAQYFLINGQPYASGQLPIPAANAGNTTLVSLFNACMDAREVVFNNAGDLKWIAQDGQGQSDAFVGSGPMAWLPALKTRDALWVAAAAGTYAVYDRHGGLQSAPNVPGGMLAYLRAGAAGASTSPAVLVPPANKLAFVGGTAQFSAVSSHNGALSYQWRKNGSPITGATLSSYTINPVATTDAGSYSVTITDTTTSGPSSTTTPAGNLAVLTQPAPVTVADGALAAFSVSVLPAGTPGLAYQWLRDGTAIAGATASSFSFNANYSTDNGHQYSVTVNGPGGPATSAGALLTVTPVAPAIVTQPANQSVPDFSTATFTVVASGSALTYQWQRRATTTPTVTYTNIPSATASSYSLVVARARDNGAVFRVVVSGPGGPSVTSSTATLTVTLAGLAIVTQPASVVVNAGQPASFTVVAVSSGTLSYRWQRLSGSTWGNLSNGGGITGTATATLSFNATATANLANAGSYRVVVTSSGAVSGSLNSSAATLTINTGAPMFTQQPDSLSVTAGVASVSFTAVAVGFPVPTFRWQRFNGTAWANVNNNTTFSGATTTTLTINNPTVSQAGAYRLQASNTYGTADSQPAAFFVTQTFAGTPVRDIPAGAGGPATPYPALTTSVPALTGASVQHASVTLTLTDPEPFDADIVIAAPGGARSVQFMAGVGPVPAPGAELPPIGPQYYFYGVTNCVLTFDDAAPAQVSTNYWLTAGTYQPTVFPMGTNWMTLPLLGFPAAVGGTGNTFSSLNNFVPPAGRWRLYVNDNQSDIALYLPAGQTEGSIPSWSLTLTAGPTPGPLPAIVADPPTSAPAQTTPASANAVSPALQ